MPSAVIDANIALYCVLPTAFHAQAIKLLEDLVKREVDLFVPHLWMVEVTTGVRKTIAAGELSESSGALALEAALNLPVGIAAEDAGLCLRALDWAARLGHSKSYDAQYMALAEELGCELLTADLRLTRSAQALGVDWVVGVDTCAEETIDGGGMR